MICKNKRCRAELPDGSKFCNVCGKSQEPTIHKNKRINGQGSVYKRSDIKGKPYVACAPAQTILKGKDKGKVTRAIIGMYATKAEAEAALFKYNEHPTEKINITLYQLHSEWEPLAYRDLDRDTQNNYNSAWYKMRTLYKIKFKDLRTGQMQQVIDYYAAPHQREGQGGKLLLDKETKQPIMRKGLSRSSLEKIKVLFTMMYDYAIQNDIAHKNYASYLVLPPKEEIERTCFTDLQLEIMRKKLDSVDYLDYIYIMCYTGHRINEFLSLTKFDYFERDGIGCLYGGNKTEAGKRKIMPLHANIYQLVKQCLSRNGDTIFCNKETGEKMTDKYFRDRCYYPALEAAGLPRYTPHACRRTLSTRMSAAEINEDDRIALMGHTDGKIDRESYIVQSLDTLFKSISKIS